MGRHVASTSEKASIIKKGQESMKNPDIGKQCFSHLVKTYSMRALSAAVYLLEAFENLVSFHY